MKVHNDNSANSGRAWVPNRRAPQGGAGGISLPTGTATSLAGSGIGTGTGIGVGTGTGSGASVSTGSGLSSGTTTSLPSTFTTTSSPVSNTQISVSPTLPTTTAPSTIITNPTTTSTTSTSSSTSTSSTSTSTTGSLTPPPLLPTDSGRPFTTSTLLSTFVSTLADGEVQSFTTPIPTALVSSAPNPSSMNHTTTIVAGTVSAFVFLVLVILAVLFVWRRNGLKLRTEEKGKEMRRLLEDEDFAVDDENRWSGGGQNRNLAPSLNSPFSDPTSSLRQIQPLTGLTPSVSNGISEQPLVSQLPIHARPLSASTSTSSPSTRRPTSSNSTLILPPSPGTHGHASLQLTPIPSSSSWISRPVSATLPPYRDPFDIGLPPLPATLSGISPNLPATTISPLSPPPRSLVASMQSYKPHSPSEWVRSPTSPTFAQVVTIPMPTVDNTPTPAATDAATTPRRPSLHRKKSTADSVISISDSVSEYSQESAPLHVLSSRLARRGEEAPPPVPPIPIMPFRPG